MPLFSRALLFPSSPPSVPMWDRPSTGNPIFAPSKRTSWAMWARPGTGRPIYEEAVVSPEPMWDRPEYAGGVPVCPCCTTSVSEERVLTSSWGGSSSGTRPNTSRTTRPGTAAVPVDYDTFDSSSTVSPVSETASRRPSLKSVPSGWGLRLKMSLRSLRSRASRANLRG